MIEPIKAGAAWPEKVGKRCMQVTLMVVDGVRHGYELMAQWSHVRSEQKRHSALISSQAQASCLLIHLAFDCAQHLAHDPVSAEEVAAGRELIDSCRKGFAQLNNGS